MSPVQASCAGPVSVTRMSPVVAWCMYQPELTAQVFNFDTDVQGRVSRTRFQS